MTAERLRAPISVRTTKLVPSFGTVPAAGSLDYSSGFRGGAGSDLFTHVRPPLVDGEPHPDFAARAAIWRDHRAGLISLAEAQRRSANVGREGARELVGAETCRRPRHSRPAPNDSRQYSDTMSTTAMRDDRLTPAAKALLVVLRARCGRGRSTTTTKFTLAAVMSRSARTIARYLRDLEAFGYVRSEIRRNGRGLHLGLVVTITEKVLPFFEEAKGLAAWLAASPEALSRPFTGRVLSVKPTVTKMSPKNQPSNIPSLARWAKLFREGTGKPAAPH